MNNRCRRSRSSFSSTMDPSLFCLSIDDITMTRARYHHHCTHTSSSAAAAVVAAPTTMLHYSVTKPSLPLSLPPPTPKCQTTSLESCVIAHLREWEQVWGAYPSIKSQKSVFSWTEWEHLLFFNAPLCAQNTVVSATTSVKKVSFRRCTKKYQNRYIRVLLDRPGRRRRRTVESFFLVVVVQKRSETFLGRRFFFSLSLSFSRSKILRRSSSTRPSQILYPLQDLRPTFQ